MRSSAILAVEARKASYSHIIDSCFLDCRFIRIINISIQRDFTTSPYSSAP
jgi:hypothetical protein